MVENLSVRAELVEVLRSFFLKDPRALIALLVMAGFLTAVLVDYKLSSKSREMMAQKQGRWTTRADVKWLAEPGTDIQR